MLWSANFRSGIAVVDITACFAASQVELDKSVNGMLTNLSLVTPHSRPAR